MPLALVGVFLVVASELLDGKVAGHAIAATSHGLVLESVRAPHREGLRVSLINQMRVLLHLKGQLLRVRLATYVVLEVVDWLTHHPRSLLVLIIDIAVSQRVVEHAVNRANLGAKSGLLLILHLRVEQHDMILLPSDLARGDHGCHHPARAIVSVTLLITIAIFSARAYLLLSFLLLFLLPVLRH